MSIDSKIAEIMEESKLAGLVVENEEAVEETPAEEVADEEVVVEEGVKVDVSADVAALMNGESLSEEFRNKAATIFESAVVVRVKEEVARLEEEFESQLAEQVESITEGLVEKIDGYLDYVVEQWMTQNEIALENGVKTDIMESFITGMKGLFEEHYIDVPEEKYDVIGEMEAQIDALSAKLDEQVERNVEMKKSLQESARKEIVKNASEGLANTDQEKFLSLVEELSFEDEETFEVKVQTIRENYFTVKPHGTVETVVTDTPVEELQESVSQHIDPSVAQYLAAIKKYN
jgi:SHS2 domain-containing protein